MKLGILGPIGGIVLAAIIIGAVVFSTPTDSNWRWLGLAVGVAVFIGSIAAAVKGERRP